MTNFLQKHSVGQQNIGGTRQRGNSRHKFVDSKSPEVQHGASSPGTNSATLSISNSSNTRHEFRAPHHNTTSIGAKKRKRGAPDKQHQNSPDPVQAPMNLSSSSDTSIASRLSQTPTTPGKLINENGSLSLLLDCNGLDSLNFQRELHAARRINQSTCSTAAPSPPASVVGSVLDLLSTAATINTSDAASTLLDDEEETSSIASTQYSSVPATGPNEPPRIAPSDLRAIGSRNSRRGSSVVAPSSTNLRRNQLTNSRPPYNRKERATTSTRTRGLNHNGTGMSLTSTSSELGIPDTVSLGSMTASPSCCCGEAMSGDTSSL